MTVEIAPLFLSLEFALVATVISGVLGIAVAAVLANRSFFGRDLLDVIFTAPIVMPPTVLGYYLLAALGRESAVGHAWESVTGSPIVFTETGVVIAMMVVAFPFVVKNARAALESTDRTLVLAARTLGATPVRAFMTVQLPLASRGIIAALMLAFARAIGEFGVTLLIGGNIEDKTRTAPIAIYDAILSMREHDAAMMVGILTALVVALLYAVAKLTRERAI